MDITKELQYHAEEADRIIYPFLPKEEGYQKTVMEAMNYSIKAGGKRLRPILMAETAKLFGDDSRALPYFMAAIEMIHTYSLVHDDLPAMDNDQLRRGKPTTHAAFGEAMGILAGDALLNYAFETALKALDVDGTDPRVHRSLKILAAKSGIYGMLGGQVVDVEAEKQFGMDKHRLDFIYELKTGALIEAAMTIGAELGGAAEDQKFVIEQAAAKIGLAFQIRDDILDVAGDEKVLGKPIGSDEKNHKVTYVTFAGLEKSEADVRELSEEAVHLLNGMNCQNPFLIELVRYLADRRK